MEHSHSTDAEAFYAAIRDNPDDDAPSLIFADWLEEQGDNDRAEFIRVQIELAGMAAGDPRGDTLREREAALLKARKAKWRLEKIPNVEWGALEKGFVRSVQTRDVGVFRRNAARIAAAAPIHCLRLSTLVGPEKATVLGGVSEIRKFRELLLRQGGVRGGEVRALSECEGLAGLWRLDLAENSIGAAGTKAIAQAPVWSELRSLDLQANKIGLSGAKALGESVTLERLESLNLRYNSLESKSLRALGFGPGLNALRDLNLAYNALCEPEAAVLAESPLLERLRSLNLGQNGISDLGLAALAQSKLARNLTKLNISSNPIGEDGLSQLFESENFHSLEILILGGLELGESTARVLTDSPHFAKLNKLVIEDNEGPKFRRMVGLLKDRFGPSSVWLMHDDHGFGSFVHDSWRSYDSRSHPEFDQGLILA